MSHMLWVSYSCTILSSIVINKSKIETQCSVMSSLQRPKKFSVIVSNGERYSFLAKSGDDLSKIGTQYMYTNQLPTWLHVNWKHTLETLSFGNIILDWKHRLDIGNKNRILETLKAFGNISLYIGNIKGVWKHKSVYWKHKSMYWKHCIWKHIEIGNNFTHNCTQGFRIEMIPGSILWLISTKWHHHCVKKTVT